MTPTCAYIQPINKPGAEVICVSLQRVSRCKGPGLGSVLPWLGHGKTRKRRQVQSSIKAVEDDDNSSTIVNTEQAAGSGQEDCNPQTRAGRTVRRPRRYLDNDSFPGRSASLVGGSCKGRRITRQAAGEARDLPQGNS